MNNVDLKGWVFDDLKEFFLGPQPITVNGNFNHINLLNDGDTIIINYDNYNKLYIDIGSYSDEQNKLYCLNKNNFKIYIKIENIT